MYFVDREKVEETLQYLEGQVNRFQSIHAIEEDLQKAALERVTQMMLDSVLDIGNMMIDGFIMRDPGSYDDIIDILLDEKVITPEMADQFKLLIPYRKQLVQHYTTISHSDLYHAFKEHIRAFQQYPDRIRNYIAHELGPVSAFRN